MFFFISVTTNSVKLLPQITGVYNIPQKMIRSKLDNLVSAVRYEIGFKYLWRTLPTGNKVAQNSNRVTANKQKTDEEVCRAYPRWKFVVWEINECRTVCGGGPRMFFAVAESKEFLCRWRISFFFLIFFTHLKLTIASIFLAKFHGGFALMTHHLAFLWSKVCFCISCCSIHAKSNAILDIQT